MTLWGVWTGSYSDTCLRALLPSEALATEYIADHGLVGAYDGAYVTREELHRDRAVWLRKLEEQRKKDAARRDRAVAEEKARIAATPPSEHPSRCECHACEMQRLSAAEKRARYDEWNATRVQPYKITVAGIDGYMRLPVGKHTDRTQTSVLLVAPDVGRHQA